MGFSTWLAGRLASNEIHQVQKSFVDQKALTDANAAFLDFQGKTKTHIAALEEEIKKLSDQLAISKAADSLKVAATPPAKGAPAKTSAPKAEEAIAKTKSGKKGRVAKAAKASAQLAKNTASRMKKKKASASAHSAAKSESYSSTPSEENPADASPAPDAAPSVPQAPGLDNQDLPPPASE